MTMHTEEKMLNTKELSRRTGLAMGYLQNLRYLGQGCSYVKAGNVVLYRESDVVKWEQSRYRYISIPTT